MYREGGSMEKRVERKVTKRGEKRGVRVGELKGGAKPGEGGVKANAREDAAIDAAEHLTRDLARVRANFGMDPLVGSRSLAGAWTSPTDVTEEGEAEFVDAVADCLGAGLSLEAALDCWDNGGLATDAVDDQAAADAADEEASAMVIPIASARHAPGRRLLVR